MLPIVSPEIRAWLAKRRAREIRGDAAEVTRLNHHGFAAHRREERGPVRRIVMALEGMPIRRYVRRAPRHH